MLRFERRQKLLVHKTNMLLKPAYEDIDLVKVNGPLARVAEQGRRYATGLPQCHCLA